MELSDSDMIFITLMGTLLFVLLLGFLFVAIYLYKRRQLEYEKERTLREQEFSEELLRSQLELTEKIMGNISEEIHDNIGQTLTVAKLNLNSVSDTDYREHTEAAKELITRSLSDLRNLSKTLNGDYILREGIHNALERELDLIRHSGEISCHLKGRIDSRLLSPNAEIVLYRCIQEAISNTLKHAGAENLELSVDQTQSDLIIEITDDGAGFEMDKSGDTGVGMQSMHKRIDLLGGRLKVVSEPGKGTRVKIYIPKQS